MAYLLWLWFAAQLPGPGLEVAAGSGQLATDMGAEFAEQEPLVRPSLGEAECQQPPRDGPAQPPRHPCGRGLPGMGHMRAGCAR